MQVSASFYHPNCEKAGLTCLDCYTQKLCINLIVSLVDGGKTPCSNELTGIENIYCNPKTDKCQSTPPSECDPVKEFKCTRDGTFPNLLECRRYIKCFNKTATYKECSPTHIYNQRYGKCVLQLRPSNCKKISCGVTNSYPGDESVYYECINGQPMLKICPEETEMYNASTKICESICKQPGLIQNTKDCSTYYSCEDEDGLLNIKKKICPEGTGFDYINLKCKKGYQKLCNEQAALQNFSEKLPIIKFFINPIIWFANLINFNPIIILLNMGVNEKLMSDLLMAFDYLLTYKKLPTGYVDFVINTIMKFIPKEFQEIINAIISKLFPNLFEKSTLTLRTFLKNKLLSLDFSDDLNDIYLNIFGDINIDNLKNYFPEINHLLGVKIFELRNNTLELNVEVLKVYISDLLQEVLNIAFPNYEGINKVEFRQKSSISKVIKKRSTLAQKEDSNYQYAFDVLDFIINFIYGIYPNATLYLNSMLDNVISALLNPKSFLESILLKFTGLEIEQVVAILQTLKMNP